MCGIVGLYEWPVEAEAVPALLRSMCATITHRGPDDEGIFAAKGIGLGMRRLSIIDVAGGHQPIQNENGDVTLVFNGEIYNYRALRDALEAGGHSFSTRTDTETIVHGYEEDGPECVNSLNGIFAFALWDAAARRLMLARDRMGVKPLYYTSARGGVAFASEIKALLALPGIERTLNLEAAGQFFRMGFVPAPLTLFRGIYKLPPATRLIAERGGIRTEQYWDMSFAPPESAPSFDESCEELRALLRTAVADQMVSDVPLGAFLSGGVDSSAVVAFMRQAATNSVKTYNIGFGSEHAYHDETPFAQATAKELGTQHKTLIVRPRLVELLPELVEKLDEPLTDTSFLVTYLISKMAREDVKVALSGVGGDEMFSGYRRYLASTVRRTVAWMPPACRQGLGKALGCLPADRGTVLGNLGRYAQALGRTLHLPLGEQYLGLISVLSAEHVASLMKSDRASEDPGAGLVKLFDRVRQSDGLDQMLYADLKTVLPESLLLLTDKMGMAASLEVRVPFLDNRIVDFVSRVPSIYRQRGFALKRLLKSAIKGLVPDFVLERSKRGFGTPMGTWLRSDLRPMVADLLENGKLRHDGLLDAGVVRQILQAHDAGRVDFTEPIFALITFELWRQNFRVGLS
ncbi:MAG TPA: asparagine synthase (glutamine-hydrolyzing) [Candidatus Binatia bacterium]|jgi:asparagine synthase (glutamine-hydrolysing)